MRRVVAHEPADLTVTVEAGLPAAELAELAAGAGQCWPQAEIRPGSTVGGVLAAAASARERLRFGAVRDSLLQVVLATGDGRLVTAGGRTVKGVSGYDIPRLAVGSLGTLGVIVQVALKVRPLPEARWTVRMAGDLGVAAEVLRAVPGAAAALATPDGVELRLEGWREEVEDQTTAAEGVGEPLDVVDDAPFPSNRPWESADVVAEVAVPPSRLAAVLGGGAWGALAGVGIAWVGVAGADDLAALRERAAEAGGIAPVVRGPGGLGDAPVPALDVQRRLKASFDPNGVLAPGRGWGGI
jgi:glycolate oxidase FAD binding subunit